MLSKGLSCQLLIPTYSQDICKSQVFFSHSLHIRRRYLDSKWPGDTPWCYQLLPIKSIYSQFKIDYNSAIGAGYCFSPFLNRRYPWLSDLTSTLKSQYDIRHHNEPLKSQIVTYFNRSTIAYGDFSYNKFCDEDFCSSGLFYGADESFNIKNAQIHVLLQAREHMSAQVLIPKDGEFKLNSSVFLLINNFLHLKSNVRILLESCDYSNSNIYSQIAWYPKTPLNCEITFVYRDEV